MGIIIHTFELNNIFASFPSEEDIIKRLEEKTHLKIFFEVREHIKTHVNGEKENFLFKSIKGSNKIKENIGLSSYDNTFSLTKGYPDYTYIFHSLMSLLTEIALDLGGGSLTLSFVSDNDTITPINSFEDLVGYYNDGWNVRDLEFAKYPYDIACTMEGFPKYPMM